MLIAYFLHLESPYHPVQKVFLFQTYKGTLPPIRKFRLLGTASRCHARKMNGVHTLPHNNACLVTIIVRRMCDWRKAELYDPDEVHSAYVYTYLL